MIRFRSRKSAVHGLNVRSVIFLQLIRIRIARQKRVTRNSNGNYVFVFCFLFRGVCGTIVDEARLRKQKAFSRRGKQTSNLGRFKDETDDSHIGSRDFLPVNSRGRVELFTVHWLFRFTSRRRPRRSTRVSDLSAAEPDKYRVALLSNT